MRGSFCLKHLSFIFLVGIVQLFVAQPMFANSVKNIYYVENSQQIRHVELSEGLNRADLINLLKTEFLLPADFDLVNKHHAYRDELGGEHQRVMQTIGGIPIYGSSLSLHKSNGKIESLSGALLGMLSFNSFLDSPYSDEEVLQIATNCVGAGSYMWEDEMMEAFLKKEKNDPTATHFPIIKKVYFPNNFPNQKAAYLKAAYVLEIYAKAPFSKKEIVIDAITGDILFESNLLHHNDEEGTAHTAFSGQRAITTFRADSLSPYELQNQSIGSGLKTFDCLNTANYLSAVVPLNESNDWDYPTLTEDAILDAHWGGEQTYEYFQDKHNWASYDNDDAVINSYVHFSLIDLGFQSNLNAFWDGERLTFGDGVPGQVNPLTSVDIYAHEFAHGVTQFSAGLIYQNESGALNESFSDIFGAAVRYHSKPEDFTWRIGDEVYTNGSGLRSMSNPNQFGDPDTYFGNSWFTGTGDNGGVHINSGVQNYWFYLLSEGASGTNDFGDFFNIEAIGIEAAEQIAFRNLSAYLNENSPYSDARFFSIMAAEDLYGACSPEVIAVTNAWHAVGVGEGFNDAVRANFQMSSQYACTLPATIHFSDFSFNADNYFWDFGDGTTSTDPSPVHTYDNAGSFTVSLIVEGDSPCNSSDTLTLENILVVEDNDPFVVPNCIPAPALVVGTGGITTFKILDIENNSEDSQIAYEDFTCGFNINLIEGNSYPVQFVLDNPDFVSIWLDENNDGDFSPNELVYQSEKSKLIHDFDWIVPAVSLYDTKLRMRLISSMPSLDNACTIDVTGQGEDYMASISDNVLPPMSDFIANITTSLPGETISFQDLSLNVPTNWHWELPGANMETSNEQAFTVAYNEIGFYDVTLITSNEHGNDTLTIPDYIHIVNAFNWCDLEETNLESGTVYDSGGVEEGYSPNDECALLIAPECASSITLSFPFFETAAGQGVLSIHDGDNSAAPILGAFSGSQIIPPIGSSGGAVFLLFEPNGSEGAGFEIQWASQSHTIDSASLNIGVDNANPVLGEMVSFFGETSNSVDDWQWDFGDANGSVLQNPDHSYLSVGTKTVVLTSSNCAYQETESLTITVQPSADINLSPSEQDLTILNCGDSIAATFTINNTGTEALVLELDSSSNIVFSSTMASILPGENTSIDFTIYRADRSVGNYQEKIGINTNLPNLPLLEYLVRLNIEGEGVLSAPVNCVVLDTIQEFDSNQKSIFIYNEGCSEMVLEDIIMADSNFDLIYESNEIAPYDSLEINIVFSPETAGIYEENINIVYNGGIEESICVSGVAVAAPRLEINGEFVLLDLLECEDSVESVFALLNTGDAVLEYAIESDNFTFENPVGVVEANGATLIAFTYFRNGKTTGNYEESIHISSNDPTQNDFALNALVNIMGEGILSIDETCLEVGPVLENSVSTVVFQINNTGCAPLNLTDFQSLDEDLIISQANVELMPNESIDINISHEPSDFGEYASVVQFEADGVLYEQCFERSVLPASVVNLITPTIEVAGSDCPDEVAGSFGFTNTGNEVLEWDILGVVGLTLQYSIGEGVLLVDETQTVDFTINTSELLTGVEDYELILNTNDPTQPTIYIPMSLTIEGTPQLSYGASDCFAIAEVLTGSSISDSIFVSNEGCAPFVIDSASADNTAFTIVDYPGQINTTVEGRWIFLEFSPETLGDYEANLVLYSESGEEQICLTGTALPAPSISVLPEAINLNFSLCADSIETEILIENIGDANLTYSVNDVFDPNVRLDSIRKQWLNHGESLTELIPNLFLFSDGETGSSIADGGGDMYDVGNVLNTNFANTISYTGNSIQSNGEFGPNGKYFTSKIPGMFLMAAEMDGVNNFSITGNLGADGNGEVEEGLLTYTASFNKRYDAYFSRTFDTGDASINHLIIVPKNEEIEVSVSDNTNEENHQVNHLENTSSIYYLLFATSGNNGFVGDDVFQSLLEEFVETSLYDLIDVVSVTASETNIASGNSSVVNLLIETAHLKPGLLDFNIVVNSNDANSPNIIIPVSINAIEAACAEFEFSAIGDCSNEIQFTDLSPEGVDTWTWDFGDGTVSNEQNPIHTYEESGTYTVGLNSGSNLIFSEYSLTIEVETSQLEISYTEPDSDGSILFSGIAPEGETWLWDFGDGTSAETQEASHVYAQSGTYTISLTTTDANGCSATVNETISITAVGIAALSVQQARIYPNPTQGVFTIQKQTASANMTVSLYDANGRMIMAPFSVLNTSTHIDIRNQVDGIFLLKVETMEGVYYSKILKQ